MTKRTPLDIILPVYNERHSVEHVMNEWYGTLLPFVSPRFIVCEDGSEDGTKEVLKHLARQLPLTLDIQEIRQGYGKAIIRGLRRATSEFVLCVDADGQYDPKDFQELWDRRFLSPVVAGVRIQRADPLPRRIYSRLFLAAFRVLFHTSMKDPSSSFVIFRRRSILPLLPYLGYLTEGFWWGFRGACVMKHLPVYEEPVHHRRRVHGVTQSYTYRRICDIALRNIIGLVRLRFYQEKGV